METRDSPETNQVCTIFFRENKMSMKLWKILRTACFTYAIISFVCFLMSIMATLTTLFRDGSTRVIMKDLKQICSSPIQAAQLTVNTFQVLWVWVSYKRTQTSLYFHIWHIFWGQNGKAFHRFHNKKPIKNYCWQLLKSFLQFFSKIKLCQIIVKLCHMK